jgi:hypothetical protein
VVQVSLFAAVTLHTFANALYIALTDEALKSDVDTRLTNLVNIPGLAAGVITANAAQQGLDNWRLRFQLSVS